METRLINGVCPLDPVTRTCAEHGSYVGESCQACRLRDEIRAIAGEIDVDDGAYISTEDLRLKAATLREIASDALGEPVEAHP